MSKILYPINVTEENRERLFTAISKNIRDYFVKSAMLPDNSRSLSRADDDFAHWMMDRSVNVDKSIDSFLGSIPESELVNRIKSKVAGIRNLERDMACANSEAFTNEKLQSVIDAFTVLTEDDSFRKDLNELNRTTGFRYVKRNEFKALINMGLRLDHAASDFERLAIRERNEEIKNVTENVKDIDANVHKYESALKKQVEALKSSGEHLTEEEIPEAIEEHERSARICENDAEVEKNRFDHLSSSCDKTRKDFETVTNAIKVHEGKLADLEGEIKKVTDDINMQTLATASDAKVYEQFRADMESFGKRMEKLKNASERDIILEAGNTGNEDISKYQSNEETIVNINERSNSLSSISAYSMTKISNALDNAMFLADPGNADSQLIRNQISKFRELYDQHTPDTVTEKTGFFGSKTRKASSSEFIRNMLSKHANDADSAAFTEDLQQACRRMTGALGKENEKISKKDSFTKTAAQIRDRKIRSIEKQQNDSKPLYDESEKKLKYNERMLNHQKSELSSFLKAKENYQTALDDFRKGAAEKQAEISRLEGRMAESRQRIEALTNQSLDHKDKADKLRDVITLGQNAKKLQNDCTDRMAAFREKCRPIPQLEDNRREKINSRLDEYIARKDERTRLFGNSQEYNDIFTKLQQARDSEPENLSDNITKLEKAVSFYIQKKGTRTIFTTKTRHARLNMARDIQSWCQSVKDSIAEKPEQISPEVEEHARAYRSNTFAMGIVSKLGLDLAMNVKKQKERSASFSEKSLNKVASQHKEFEQPKMEQQAIGLR